MVIRRGLAPAYASGFRRHNEAQQFDRLDVPPASPVRILLQRFGPPAPTVPAPNGLVPDDRSAEIDSHESYGPTVVNDE